MTNVNLALCSGAAILGAIALPTAADAAVTPVNVSVNASDRQDITQTAQRLTFELDNLPRAQSLTEYNFIDLSVDARGDFSGDNPNEYLDVFLDGTQLRRLTGFESDCCDVSIFDFISIDPGQLHDALADNQLEVVFQAGPGVNVFAGIPVGPDDIFTVPSSAGFSLSYSFSTVVPIPAAAALLGPALLGFGWMARRRLA